MQRNGRIRKVARWLSDQLTEKIGRTFDMKYIEGGTAIGETTTLKFGALKSNRENVLHIILYSPLMNLQNRILSHGTPDQLHISPVSVGAECTWEKIEFRFNYEIIVRKER